MRSGVLIVMLVACGSSETIVVDDHRPLPAGAEDVLPVVAAPALPVPEFPFDVPASADRVVALSGSRNASCVVRASGHVDCWGELGRGGGAIGRIPELTDALDVRVSDYHHCVHTRSGVLCNSKRWESEVLVPVRGLTSVIALANGRPMCARTQRGIACWNDSFRAAAPKPFADVVEYVDDHVVACLVQKRGGVRCRAGGRWHPIPQLEGGRSVVLGEFGGSNTSFYQEACAIVGRDVRCVTLNGETEGDTLSAVKLDFLTPAAADAMRGATSLVLANDLHALVGGKVVIVQRGEPPREVPRLTDAVTITPTCALRATGVVVCWGVNTKGALGLPYRGFAKDPVIVVGVADVVSLSRTRYGIWAVTASGALYRWGDMIAGWAVRSPLVDDAIATVSDAVTYAGPCVLRRTGGVTCIDREGRSRAIAVANVVGLEASRDTYTAVAKDGFTTRWSWTGHGTNDGRIESIGPLPGIAEVDGDSVLTCMRDAVGKVSCADVACEHDKANSRWDCIVQPGKPVAVPESVELAIHHGTACARTRRGEVWCWGSNYFRQVGHRDPEMNAPPRPVPGITGATGLARDDGTFCAVHGDGRLTCWGGLQKAPPIERLPAGSVTAPIIGTTTGCYVRADRRVACWGGNASGELGDGSVVTLETPAAVPGL